MNDVYYSNTAADWVALEGLYVNKLPPDRAIVGVNLNLVGMAGYCVRGPVVPQIIPADQFAAYYGGRDYGSGGAVVGKVWAALQNKKFGRVCVCRVVADDAVAASHVLQNVTPATIATLTANNPGLWANGATGGITYDIAAASDANANHWNLTINYLGASKTYENLDTTTGHDNLEEVVGNSINNLVVVTKNADGRPLNTVSTTSLAGGTEGTLAAADYVTGINAIATYPGVACCIVPETAFDSNNSTLNARLVALAPLCPDRVFLAWAGKSNSVADEISQKGSQITTAATNLQWCFNRAYEMDPDTSTQVLCAPHVAKACILSQTDVSIHAGDEDNLGLLAWINSVVNESLTRSELISLKEAGISTLQKAESGFRFGTDVDTTATATVDSQFPDERATQFIIQSIANNIRHDVRKKGTKSKKRSIIAKIRTFLSEDQKAEHVVDADDDDLGLGFLVDDVSVNTAATKVRHEHHVLIRVRLIDHLLYIVLDCDIRTGQTIVVS
jgi:hypothetical protein